MSESKQAATPVPAATILLIRDGQAGIEVFMVVRHHQIDFASGALVFPGGKVDAQDNDNAWQAYLPATTDAAMDVISIAAIRESFEECGVLLARGADSNMVSAELLTSLDNDRDRLNAKEIQFISLFKDHDLTLASDQLVHFAHWITPPMMPKRFDTHFFLAATPEDHALLHDGHESVDSVWINPATALEEAAQGKRTVIFPTLRNLEKLARFHTVDEALSATRGETIVPVTPWVEKREEGSFLCIPDNAGYAHCEELMPSR
jgi:8-oxo-dGTP pyrophosphatase MutT (NUDIX family)